MRVLVLDEEFPFPVNSGKRTRSFNLYKRLAKSANLQYIGYGEPRSSGAFALEAEGIDVIAVPPSVPKKNGAEFYLKLLLNLASPLPYIVTSHRSRIYDEAVRRSIQEFRPDLVICEWTPYAIYVRNVTSIKKILSTHNIESDIWYRYSENEPSLARRLYIKEQWRKVDRFERACVGWVDGAVAVSDGDRARLAAWNLGLSTATVANGVDLDYFGVLPQPPEQNQLVFTGSMDWRPNQDAAQYFVREVFPILKGVKPDLECTFVGRDPPQEIVALSNTPGIHITGTVDDVRPYVRRSAVYVVPLRVGGGSRLKILEAMAMGRAVVSTTVGAEGLNVEHERHVLLADNPRAIADAVLRLLQSSDERERLARNGRELVEKCYGWDALALVLEKFARQIVEMAPNSADGVKGRTPG
jgi:polysaccharide biosynthesis protein PslH